MLTWDITFDTITPESAERGNYADSGFEKENETGTLRDLIDDAKRYGIYGNAPNNRTRWFDSASRFCSTKLGRKLPVITSLAQKFVLTWKRLLNALTQALQDLKQKLMPSLKGNDDVK